jgi:hypothetical protein
VVQALAEYLEVTVSFAGLQTEIVGVGELEKEKGKGRQIIIFLHTHEWAEETRVG